MDLESVADELYSLPRDEFTAARNAAAARAREQGNRHLAEQISGLRRPSTAAWLANLLAREQPGEVRALVELGDGLRAAQHRRHGDELRRLSQQRHELVHALVRQAQALARTAGHPAGPAVTRELVNTFTAAVNSSTAAQALAGARLTAALDPADAATEAFAGAGAVDSSWPSPGDDTGHEPDGRLHRDLERFRAEAAEAGTARDEAQRALAAAEQAEHEARRRAQQAQRDFDAADRAAREAQRRVHDLQRRLAQRTSG